MVEDSQHGIRGSCKNMLRKNILPLVFDGEGCALRDSVTAEGVVKVKAERR